MQNYQTQGEKIFLPPFTFLHKSGQYFLTPGRPQSLGLQAQHARGSILTPKNKILGIFNEIVAKYL